MDDYLEFELRGAIFCDPNFVNNFLAVDSTKLRTVLDRCEDECDAFARPKVTKELELYGPVRHALNTIKRAVDGNPNHNHPSLFEDIHSSPIPSHLPGSEIAIPDLALFDGPTRHWETLRMPIEVKTLPTYLKTGMKQLARDAYAVFSNQLHRRRLYGMVVCSWDATFVRFDRSGILYSKPVDMSSEEFRKAFAALMMLDDDAFGYDTAFTTRPGRDGRLEYYVDLPAAAFSSVGGPDTASDTSITRPEASQSFISKPPTRRLKVTRVLCHRKSIRARATIVLQLREVLRPGISQPEETRKGAKTRSRTRREQQSVKVEVLGTRNYVLKLMWRDLNKRVEGEVLERLVGVYGVVQYLWHSDVFKACTSPNCERSMSSSCEHCLDKTPDRDNVLVVENLADLDIKIPEEVHDDGEATYKAVKTDKYLEAYARRTPRIYCRLLMSTVGSPLSMAESPRQLLEAVLDAILGYWRLVNKGLLHRDISVGNVLMLQDPNGYNRREWKDQRVTKSGQESALAKSEALLQQLLDELDRDPGGVLSDFDLFTTHNWMGVNFFDDPSSEVPAPGAGAKPGTSARCEDADTGERDPKRRKLNPTIPASAPPSSSGKGKEPEPQESGLTGITKANKGACQGIDFRTGTPTFMSLRVLRTLIGQCYEHSFMDDLESFFWLILWCVLERVEPGNTNSGVGELLNLLDHPNLVVIAGMKSDLLASCFRDDGDEMKDALAPCQNSWGTDPMIVSVIMEMGLYFYGIARRRIFQYTPVEVFPKIVKMITDALNGSGSDSADSDNDPSDFYSD